MTITGYTDSVVYVGNISIRGVSTIVILHQVDILHYDSRAADI